MGLGCCTRLVSLVHIGAILAQQVERRHVVIIRGDVQRRATVLIIDIG